MDQARQHLIPSLIIIWLGLVCLASAQSACPPINIDDLGSTTDFSPNGLVSLAIDFAAESSFNIPVRIIDYHVVCDASGFLRNTSSFVSVLVQFQCSFPISGGPSLLPTCDGSTIITRQYQFSCVTGNEWAAIVSGITSFVETMNPRATFLTPPDNQCRRCVDERQNSNADSITHCEREFCNDNNYWDT